MESARNSCFGARLDQRAASGWKLPATLARLLSPRRLQDQCSALPRVCRAPMPAGVVVVGGCPFLPVLPQVRGSRVGGLALPEVLAPSAPKREQARPVLMQPSSALDALTQQMG